MHINRMLQVITLAGLVLILTGGSAMATSFTVTLDTSTLSGTQTVAFGLTNGDGVADNSVTLSAFHFGGGSAIAGTQDCTFGGMFSGIGCSGNLTSGVTLDDSGTQALFTEQFHVGSSLSFALATTNNFFPLSPIPDGFDFFLCDATVSTCYSDASTSAMLVLPLAGGTLSPSDFILSGATAQGLPAPVVTLGATPEPESFLLMLTGLFALGAYSRKWIAAKAS